MKRFPVSTILGLTLGILLAFGVAVSAFQSPQLAPPQGNVPAPLNTGPSDQIKTGGLLQVFGLWVNQSLGVTGGATFGGTVNLQNNKIINVGTPSLAGDVATKGFVDSVVGTSVYQQLGEWISVGARVGCADILPYTFTLSQPSKLHVFARASVGAHWSGGDSGGSLQMFLDNSPIGGGSDSTLTGVTAGSNWWVKHTVSDIVSANTGSGTHTLKMQICGTHSSSYNTLNLASPGDASYLMIIQPQ